MSAPQPTSHQPGPPRTTETITLKPVTSSSDVPALADINERALDGDPLKRWMALYIGRTEWESTVDAVSGALSDPSYHVVKAVVCDSETDSGAAGGGGKERIVGFVHWMCGYIHLEGGYNSAQCNLKKDIERLESGSKGEREREREDVKDPSSGLVEDLARESSRLRHDTESKEEDGDEEVRARRLERGETKYVETRNHYIGAVRGKKHMFVRRLMVLPEFQGRGIGRRLMKVVTGEADRQKIVCWLFSRPAGERMYESLGFRVISVTDMDEPEDGFVCPASKGMMRLPRPVM